MKKRDVRSMRARSRYLAVALAGLMVMFSAPAFGQPSPDRPGAGGGASRFWSLTGNAGTTGSEFLGTTDDVALELRVNGTRALRLEPADAASNLIGGCPDNMVTAGVVGATIAGGGTLLHDPEVADDRPFPNGVTDDYGDKVVALPVTSWRYKPEDDAVRHIGPVAQDFQAAFGVGADDTHISTVDADGVALAAIQGLNEKVEARNQQLEAEVVELKSRLSDAMRSDEILAAAKTPTASGVPTWMLALAALSALGFGLGVGMGLRRVSPGA